jgi:hypothetical protein
MITGTGGGLDHKLEGCRRRNNKERTKQSLLLRTQSSGLCGCQACISRETGRQERQDWKRGNGSADVPLKNLKKKTRPSQKKSRGEFLLCFIVVSRPWAC